MQQAQAESAAAALKVSLIQAQQADLAVTAATAESDTGVKMARLEVESAETELRKIRNGAARRK